jgi:RNase P/RNase MRP subunit POP5
LFFSLVTRFCQVLMSVSTPSGGDGATLGFVLFVPDLGDSTGARRRAAEAVGDVDGAPHGGLTASGDIRRGERSTADILADIRAQRSTRKGIVDARRGAQRSTRKAVVDLRGAQRRAADDFSAGTREGQRSAAGRLSVVNREAQRGATNAVDVREGQTGARSASDAAVDIGAQHSTARAAVDIRRAQERACNLAVGFASSHGAGRLNMRDLAFGSGRATVKLGPATTLLHAVLLADTGGKKA